MEETTNLKLPLLVSNQSQKEITHNEALTILDNLINNGVKDKDLTTPPENPSQNDLYIVGVGASGEWEGKDNQLAFYDNGWRFCQARQGTKYWVNDENCIYVFNSTSWTKFSNENENIITELSQLDDVSLNSISQDDILKFNGTNFVNSKELNNLTGLGINCECDNDNKLATKSNYVLFDNNGTDSKVKVNKSTATQTASHLFQNNYSGRAEFGLIGNDDFTLKVSSDGSEWKESFVVDKTTGNIDFKQNFTLNNLELSTLKKEVVSLNNDTEIIFTDIDDGYNHIFDFVNVAASDDNVNLLINLSIDGIEYDTNGNYQYSAIGQSRAAPKVVGEEKFNFASCYGYNSDNTDNYFRLAQNTFSGSMSTNGLSNTNGVVYNANIEFFNPSANGNKIMFYKEIFRQSNGTSIFFNGQGTWTQNSPYKAIKFTFTSGSFVSGLIKHYIKK